MPHVRVRRMAGRAARRLPGLRALAARYDDYRRCEQERNRCEQERNDLARALAEQADARHRSEQERDDLARALAEKAREHDDLVRRIKFPPGHFYSPQPDPAEYALCHDPMAGPPPDPATLAGLDLNGPGQLATLRRLEPYYNEQPFGAHPRPGLRYHFFNHFFTFADALSLYGLMRLHRPRQVVEVGSGYSTCVMLDTVERYLGGECHLTLIEPYPEDRLLVLTTEADRVRSDLIRSRVQEIAPSFFDRLGPGDMLFIDSSHVAKAGSDVNYLLFEVLPRLAPGVLVHFHDILYPFEYPRVWLDEGRAWNEAYLVRAFLTFNPAFEVVLFHRYLAWFHRDYLAEAMPLYLTDRGGSLWLRRV